MNSLLPLPNNAGTYMHVIRRDEIKRMAEKKKKGTQRKKSIIERVKALRRRAK